MKLAKKIIAKYEAKAKKYGITENFGEKDYRIFMDKVNQNNDLSYAEKADLCGYLSEYLSYIS